jgi:hypothetical protein
LKDSLSDCCLNPSKSTQTKAMKTGVFQIPVIDCRKERCVPNFKDADYQRIQQRHSSIVSKIN